MIDKEQIKTLVRSALEKKLSAPVHGNGYIFAANWKMNQDKAKVESFCKEIRSVKTKDGDSILIFPPFVYLDMLARELAGSGIGYGTQNVSCEKSGAFTGEVSADMISEFGCKYAIVGHSERRSLYKETDGDCARKIRMLHSKNIAPVLCVGEKESARRDGSFEEVIKIQLTHSLAGLKPEDGKKVIIAYEPVWAIGTGLVASIEQIASTHKFIREVLCEIFKCFGKDIPILYGGSVKPDNIKGISKVNDVGGFLVGGASLKASSFIQMIETVEKD